MKSPEEIKKPHLATAVMVFLFVHLAKKWITLSREPIFKAGFTIEYSRVDNALRKLFRSMFIDLSRKYKEAISEVSNYYFDVTFYANQADNMDGMIEAMKEYLKNEKVDDKS